MPNRLINNERLIFLTTVCILTLSIAVWTAGLRNSVILDPAARPEQKHLGRVITEHTPEILHERMLALDYWRRYDDIRSDPYFGEGGPNGVFGARDHYQQHGKWEGRIYGPTPVVADLHAEKPLAEAYWKRYPDVAQSMVWGRGSSLGLLGPRDHYRYVGKYLGNIWGVQNDLQNQEHPPQPAD